MNNKQKNIKDFVCNSLCSVNNFDHQSDTVILWCSCSFSFCCTKYATSLSEMKLILLCFWMEGTFSFSCSVCWGIGLFKSNSLTGTGACSAAFQSSFRGRYLLHLLTGLAAGAVVVLCPKHQQGFGRCRFYLACYQVVQHQAYKSHWGYYSAPFVYLVFLGRTKVILLVIVENDI